MWWWGLGGVLFGVEKEDLWLIKCYDVDILCVFVYFTFLKLLIYYTAQFLQQQWFNFDFKSTKQFFVLKNFSRTQKKLQIHG